MRQQKGKPVTSNEAVGKSLPHFGAFKAKRQEIIAKELMRMANSQNRIFEKVCIVY